MNGAGARFLSHHRIPTGRRLPPHPDEPSSSSSPQHQVPEPTEDPMGDDMGSYFSTEELAPDGASRRRKQSISVFDALAVTAILSHRLPQELIPPVLGYARYFPRTILASRTERRSVG